MKLATAIVNGAHRACLIGDDQIVRVTDLPDGLAAARLAGSGFAALDSRVVEEARLDSVCLTSPIPRPGKIFGSGINYRSHKDENPSAVMPSEPGFFSKFPSSVIGPGDPIRIPAADSHVDYEVELAVVIGRPGRDIPEREAFKHVLGYTVINDVSGRDVQFRPNQMDLGKGFDTFCPMGPWIVARDEIADVAAITVRSWVNGELRQEAATAEWIFSVPQLIAHASRSLTLEPGDVISTGTPAGCGTFRNPPLWLTPGDEVVVEAEGIGRLSNPVIAGW